VTLQAYHELIAGKRVAFQPRGFGQVDEGKLPSRLFDHQRHGAAFALRCGSSALFYDTGLGKTGMALVWGDEIVRRTNKPVLMLAPLAVGAQHVEEAAAFGIEASQSRDGSAPFSPRIVITNYERLEKVDPSYWAGVILDECFAPDTNIDVCDQFGNISTKHIESIQIGDRILNAAGVDTVSDVHRREVPYAVRVSYAGQSITASPNHPFFTLRGWVGAQDLRPGDEILATSEAVRILRQDVSSAIRSGSQDALLRSILLSEMADASTEVSGESPHSGSRSKAWPQSGGVPCQRRSSRKGRVGAHYQSQPNVESGSQSQSLPPIERDRARTFRAWGQWARHDIASVGFDGCAARQLESGICFVVGSADSRLSHSLQNRLGRYRAANRYRGGWLFSPLTRGAGCQKDRGLGSFRVDGVEVLESRHHELDRYRDAAGKLYFYDLGGTRHPSFSINGGLVHNSSILKSFTGKTTRKLINAFAKTPYRLACTATPAPNDHTELGQHSAFLGVMEAPEMLSRWFIADQTQMGRYRLKKPAVRPFWDWVASWARCVSKPSDLGFSDAGFDMPALNLHRHLVAADRGVDTGEEKNGQIRLFRTPDMSATSIHKEKRLTSIARAARLAELVAAEPAEPWIIWVETDYDADAVREAIPEAIEVRGSMAIERKEERLQAFSQGEVRVLLSKPSICGFGLNWQHCARMGFMGLSFSYESFYQAVRRCWRFRQKRAVDVHVVCADTEEAIWQVVNRKAGDHDAMKAHMAAAMARAARASEVLKTYQPKQEAALPSWL
jgi:hypothetical protein